MTSKRLLALSPVVLAIACGGTVIQREDGSNDYDSGTSGYTASGGATSGAGGKAGKSGGPGRAGAGTTPAGGGAPSGGKAGVGGERPASGGFPSGSGGFVGAAGSGYAGCCLALPVCDAGDKQIGYSEICPPGFDCYQRAKCCSTVTCISLKGCSAGPPVCKPGDGQLMGICPYPCYQVSSCGTTVSCMPMIYPSFDAGAPNSCNPALEYNRNYVATSSQQCAVIDYGCPMFTTGFGNACGCGCEQNPGCPEWANCMPTGGPIDRFCTEAGRQQCPYTKRAL